MKGKGRGFLLLFIFFMTVAIGAAVVGFVDTDGTLKTIRAFANEAFPLDEDEGQSILVASDSRLEGAEFLTGAAMEAMKQGKASPGDILALGQLYMKARSDGQLDDQETVEIFELADRAGIVDAVIDQALESEEIDDAASESADTHAPPASRDTGVGQELRSLIAEVEKAQLDGSLNPAEVMTLIQRANAARLPEKIGAMVPPDYDDTRTRAVARNLAKAMITGRASVQDARTIANLFIEAQADGRIDHAEIDRITNTAERLALK